VTVGGPAVDRQGGAYYGDFLCEAGCLLPSSMRTVFQEEWHLQVTTVVERTNTPPPQQLQQQQGEVVGPANCLNMPSLAYCPNEPPAYKRDETTNSTCWWRAEMLTRHNAATEGATAASGGTRACRYAG
jgi:hypothetical protein